MLIYRATASLCITFSAITLSELHHRVLGVEQVRCIPVAIVYQQELEHRAKLLKLIIYLQQLFNNLL
ncbi:MAG TPA: hypothetical protein ENI27_02130 [bacterium]|nr:hypothetical protein [bacterium]